MDNEKGSQEDEESPKSEKIDMKAEKFIEEVISTIQNKTEEFGKTISDYKTALQRPLADVYKTEQGYVVKFDLPGVKKKDISLKVSEDSVNVMVIFEDEAKNVTYLQRERSHGKTIRSLTLPSTIDVEKVNASFNDSILTIELPEIQKEVHKVDIS